MPQQLDTSVENNFTKGLITESTGLNFPENAATDADNCTFTLVGDTLRRAGINYEANNVKTSISKTNNAISSYKWNNVSGDGSTQIVVIQNGAGLYFYKSNVATISAPLSSQILSSTINLSNLSITGTADPTLECQYAEGNGYLFVFHPSCDPFYCTYSSGTVSGTSIPVQIRDFAGIPDSFAANTRSAALSQEHLYNLINQGWIKGSPWSATSSTSVTASTGVKAFTVSAGLTVSVGDKVSFTNVHFASPGGNPQPPGSEIMVGDVTGYSGTTLTVNITYVHSIWLTTAWNDWQITPTSTGYLSTFLSATGTYPSNGDVWWTFRNASGIFDPATTVSNVSLNSGNAPRGHIILNAFNQQRWPASGVSGLTDIVTNSRPRTGCWFQGRAWYTGVDAQQFATGDEPDYFWTENIYFSQIVKATADLGKCYQVNDPTSSTLFGLLPTDGGVITIQGCGSIYKLFPLQNALLVFATNGVWYLTGSTGIGFTANDYTIVKLSSVRSISSTSFVDVHGLPYFWNEEGIYAVEPAKQGSGLLSSPLHVNPLEVNPITVGTILGFFNNIPTSSKKYVRGAYDPVEYVIQWIYRDTEANDVTSRYTYNKILNFNTFNKAFYPYSVDSKVDSINSIVYVSNPGGFNAADSTIKYFCSNSVMSSFAEEFDTNYVDWGHVNYISYFVTGYKLRGQAIKKFQPQYVQIYSRTNGASSAYQIQGIWNYANDPNSGKWSAVQVVNNALTRYSTVFRRHKIRGNGFALQLKVSSVDGQPFDIQGWAIADTVNAGV